MSCLPQTWYGNQARAESCNIGTLAVICPLMEQMRVAQIIDQHIPADPQAEYDHGAVLSLLIAARLYLPIALVNVQKWAAESGADILWNIPVEKINDDRLGRSLDAFFTQRHSILASFAFRVSQVLGIPLSELHYDPTHILFHGVYEDSEPREALPDDESIPSNEQLPPAHITKGRRMGDAPYGRRMIHAGLCTYVDELGAVPLYGHTVGGNENGHTAVAQQYALIKKHLRPPKLTMISDRGTYSIVHLARLHREGYDALCSAPWGDFRALYDQNRRQLKWKKASYLSLEQQRRRKEGDLPQEHYELAVLRHELQDPESKEYVPVRVVFVFSTGDQKVSRQQRERQIEKIERELVAIQQSVAGGRRNTDLQSVARRVERAFARRDAAKYFSYQMIPLTKQQRSKLPPPQRGCKRPTHRFEFTLDGDAAKQDQEYDGLSVLVTTATQTLSADQLFRKFKNQTYVEHANHIFKGPLAVRPVYLQNDRRVEALVFLMMMSLTLYFALQRKYRETVPDDATTKERRTTARTLLRDFSVYTLLVHRTGPDRHVQPTLLTARQRQIMQRLKLPTPAQVLSQRLPRPPT